MKLKCLLGIHKAALNRELHGRIMFSNCEHCGCRLARNEWGYWVKFKGASQ